MFKKVMMAVDLSSLSMELLDAVDDLKRMGLKELILVHVIRTEMASLGLSSRRREFLDRIKELKEKLESESLIVKVLQPVGNPHEEIKYQAEAEKVDLVVIGSYGEGFAVRRLLLGSTASGVMRGVKTPVLVQRYSRKKGKPERVPIFEDGEAVALLATDFSRNSLHVFDTFLEHTDIFKKVILFHVVDEGYTEEQLAENKAKAMEKLAGWEEEFRDKGVDVEIDIVTGIASTNIVKAARKRGATLVAVARRGRSMFDEILIGSTADGIVRRSPCPVLLLIS